MSMNGDIVRKHLGTFTDDYLLEALAILQTEAERRKLPSSFTRRMHNFMDALQYCDRCEGTCCATEDEPNILCARCYALMPPKGDHEPR